MEFTEYQCPVCGKQFENGDDIVVCPECGSPHHRECYESIGHCFYENRHTEGYSFDGSGGAQTDDRENDAETIKCPQCGFENEKTQFYCNQCGYPLNSADRQKQQNSQPNEQQGPYNQGQNQNPYGGFQGMPFGFSTGAMPAFDPLDGMNPDEEIAEGIKVSEAAKFIGKNTQYFLRVFRRIRDQARSKINFSAVIFAEVYFLYRKITVIGVICSLFMMATNVASAAIMMSPEWTQSYSNLMSAMQSGVKISVFSSDFAFMYLPLALEAAQLAVRILCGLFANKLYYRHCQKQIRNIKQTSSADMQKTLEQKGGVNLPLAVSFYAAGFVISYICSYLAQM